jgi:formate dehydrogenase accessory protein FdhE
MKNVWDSRIRRASELTSVYPFAAEGLRFYAQLLMLQQNLASQLEQSATRVFIPQALFHEALNSSGIVSLYPGFLNNVCKIAPTTLAKNTDDLSKKDPAEWQKLIEEFWASPSVMADETQATDHLTARYLTWIFLQPFAEYIVARRSKPSSDGNARQCPVCSAAPVVGVLRPEGDGARKSLICMLCAHEWAFRRIYCPGCGEERESHMAFYSAPEISHVRVDVCDTCRTYTKSIDLTKFGLAIPVVDELAALPLDLWARENGYRKLQMNAIGM